MRDRIDRLVGAARDIAASVGAGSLDADDAVHLVEGFAELERLAVAGRMLAMARVTELAAWKRSAHRSPAHWLAARTGTAVGAAVDAVQTAARLRDLPSTRGALLAGKLSEVKVVEITAAAVLDPAAESSLLDSADRDSVAELKGKCREVRAAALSDEDAAERIRAGRYLRDWVDRDGAVRLDGRFAPDDGARLLAVVRAQTARLEDEGRRSGHRESSEAYAADALVSLADTGDGPRAVVQVHVDAAALSRGRLEPGETCRIEGVGPVPVAVAERMATDAVIKVLAKDAHAVTEVVHLGRTIPARVRTALEARDRTCVVPGATCGAGSRSITSISSCWAGRRNSRTWPGCAGSTTARRRTTGGRWEGRPGRGRGPAPAGTAGRIARLRPAGREWSGPEVVRAGGPCAP